MGYILTYNTYQCLLEFNEKNLFDPWPRPESLFGSGRRVKRIYFIYPQEFLLFITCQNVAHKTLYLMRKELDQ